MVLIEALRRPQQSLDDQAAALLQLLHLDASRWAHLGSCFLNAGILTAKPLILLAAVSWTLVSPSRNVTVDEFAGIAMWAILSIYLLREMQS